MTSAPGYSGPPPPGPHRPDRTGLWLWMIGTAVVVFAARCREISLHASEVPYLDQWKVEAQQILIPWLRGQLSWPAFFVPHHEHTPLWTRLLAWLEAAALGRWDPLLQCTVNAALFGAAIGVWAGWLRRTLPLLPALFITALAIILAALPHGWENSTWGFQSLVPIALLGVFWHVRGSFEAPAWSFGWWGAQFAGLAALFTLGSMWTGPAAVILVAWWTAAPGRWRWLPAAGLAVAGIAMLLTARALQPHTGALAMSVQSPQQFLAAVLLQLGWPARWPGAAALLHLPAFFLALDLRRNRAAENADRVALALAVFAVGQAAAFAYGRGGGYIGFVSRYGDLLALGVVANAFALWRLLHRHRPWRPLLVIAALGWLAAFAHGLQYASTRAHTEYFHERSAVWALLRRDAVRHYLETKDATPLSTETARQIIFPDPAVVTAVLDEPGLSRLLPVSLRHDGRRARGDFISAAARRLRELWPMALVSGGVVLLLGAGLTWHRPGDTVPPSKELPVDRGRLPVMGVVTALSGALVFLWPMPLQFHDDPRWKDMLIPSGVVTDISFLITTPTTYQVDNLTGGASLWPENFRNVFYGTHIDGPGFIGRAQSSVFKLESPWVVIPFAGFPASPGNSIRLQIEAENGQPAAELVCPGPNPADLDFWSVDVRAYAGRQARLVFFDGRNDSAGWIAAVPPQPAHDARQAERLQRSWALERTTGGHRSLAVIAASFLLLTLFAAVRPGLFPEKIKCRAPAAPP